MGSEVQGHRGARGGGQAAERGRTGRKGGFESWGGGGLRTEL